MRKLMGILVIGYIAFISLNFYNHSRESDLYMKNHSQLVLIHLQHLDWKSTGICEWDVEVNGSCDALEKSLGSYYLCGYESCCEADNTTGTCKVGGIEIK